MWRECTFQSRRIYGRRPSANLFPCGQRPYPFPLPRDSRKQKPLLKPTGKNHPSLSQRVEKESPLGTVTKDWEFEKRKRDSLN